MLISAKSRSRFTFWAVGTIWAPRGCLGADICDILLLLIMLL
jgi:hypothetical protein